VTTPASPDALTQRVRDELGSRPAVREVRMFGGVAFMVDGRMAVSAGRDGDLLVRVDPARYDELLRRGAEPASMGADRPMGRRWLSVPASQLSPDGELAFWVAVGIGSRDAPG
jgi:TfoX/Sxy family transcriptional regulator of competence genes